MRLTLRTLLSYLDDTLEPAQAKAIGAKVAESEQARDLVERIKQVTRRRRLTTPPTAGPGGMDANTIAEYLDNEVTPEKAAEVEQICLASDVHLAEVAACHQILTLVLGEPALVPPSAKQRMYGLVKGPESIPFRKPAKPATSAEDNDLSSEIELDQDEALRLGVPAVSGGKGSSKVWLFVGGGVLAVLVFSFAVYQLITGIPNNRNGKDKDKDNDAIVHVDKKEPPPRDADKDKDKDKGDKDRAPSEKDKDKDKDGKSKIIEEPQPQPKVDQKLPEIKVGSVDPEVVKDLASIAYLPASKKQERIGAYTQPGAKTPAVLLQEKSAKGGWGRLLGKSAAVNSGQMLMSPPGSKNVVQLNSGIEVTLWGNLFEVTMDPSMAESRVIVHTHDVLAADLTLDRGRIVLTSRKKDEKEALVRIRFMDPMLAEEKYFDLVLGPGSAVIVERSCEMDPGEPFYEDPKNPMRKGPIANMRIFALAGTSSVRLGDQAPHSLDGEQRTLAQWQNRQGTLTTEPLKAVPPWLKGTPPGKKEEQLARDKAVEAHDYLARLLENEKKQIDVALAEVVQSAQQSAQREIDKQKFMSVETYVLWRHALRTSAAIDDVNGLFEAFSGDGTPLIIRAECITVLRYWLGQDRDNEYKLLDVLRSRHAIKKTPSTKIMELFHLVSQEKARDPATYQILIEGLNNELLPIRMLSHWHLCAYLAPMGVSIPYDPAMPRERRELAVREWVRLIPPGQLPPAPKQPKKDKS